jgi:hypothetical protein
MAAIQPIDGIEPLARWRRLLEANECRARDAEARLRFIVAELQIRELSEKLADTRRARTSREPEGHSAKPEVAPATALEEVAPATALETVRGSTGPGQVRDERTIRDDEKRPRGWKWGRATRRK